MAFSREDLTVYESKPQTEVDSKTFDPFNPTVPLGVEVEATAESSPEVVAEPPVEGIDGSTTEQEAEPVAAELDSPEVDKDPDITEPADGRTRNRAQERITELVDERNAVKEYNKYLQSKLDELLRMQAGLSAKPAESDSSPAKVSQTETDELAPTLENADYDPVKLNKLQNEWIQKQVNKQVKAAVSQIETRQSELAIQQAFATRTAEFRKTTPDFDVILSNPALPQLAPEAARAVIKADNGPAIAYHLGKNPDLAVRISKMTVEDQKAAVYRLEGQIIRTTSETKDTKEPSKVVTKAPAKVTKAPPPPKPVSSSSGIVQKDMAQMSMEEWVAYDRSRKIADRQAKQKLRQAMR